MIPLRTAFALLFAGATLALLGATWVDLDVSARTNALISIGAVTLALVGLDAWDRGRPPR